MRGTTPKIATPLDRTVPPSRTEPEEMAKKYLSIRAQSEALCPPLKTEDYGVQSMPDVSPPKWHLAHTTWFFKRFLLMNFEKGYEPFDAHFHYLFNSYYKSLGPHQLRSERGLISRPTV